MNTEHASMDCKTVGRSDVVALPQVWLLRFEVTFPEITAHSHVGGQSPHARRHRICRENCTLPSATHPCCDHNTTEQTFTQQYLTLLHLICLFYKLFFPIEYKNSIICLRKTFNLYMIYLHSNTPLKFTRVVAKSC